ncbi:hypothetical protein MTR_6g453210 [Medicago truncatula]|uniref:Uncharacterized protein n=1 Tax=Medicago truncatula TaxID=3880 RepID=A0A072UB97_MEDTR|nr:hypothetical protein MTR_6g453210 [Medicago truncatula]
MAAWTTKVENNNDNNRNNLNRGVELIPVIRVCNNIPTIVTRASRIVDNSRRTVKDIARQSVLITYILSFLKPMISSTGNSTSPNNFTTKEIGIEQRDMSEETTQVGSECLEKE